MELTGCKFSFDCEMAILKGGSPRKSLKLGEMKMLGGHCLVPCSCSQPNLEEELTLVSGLQAKLREYILSSLCGPCTVLTVRTVLGTYDCTCIVSYPWPCHPNPQSPHPHPHPHHIHHPSPSSNQPLIHPHPLHPLSFRGSLAAAVRWFMRLWACPAT